jgi:hypothetical protein
MDFDTHRLTCKLDMSFSLMIYRVSMRQGRDVYYGKICKRQLSDIGRIIGETLVPL